MNYIEQLNGFRIARTQTPLNTNAIVLYFILLEYNNSLGWIESFSVANSVLEGLSGLSRKSLDNARRELVNKGYISYKKGVGNQCGRYVIVQFGTQSAHSWHTVGTQSAHNHSTLTKQNKTKLKKDLPISPEGELPDIFEERFNSFWTAYPKKVGKGKTEEWFNKKKPSAKLLGDMLAAISVQNHTEQWQKDGGQYIPNPTTWLNQERWRDTPQGLSEAPVEAESKDVFYYMNGGK